YTTSFAVMERTMSPKEVPFYDYQNYFLALIMNQFDTKCAERDQVTGGNRFRSKPGRQINFSLRV
ncbi:hypothetical protein, partial [Desulfogranum japonicum]|uniref:hypothetical protein n=1 Tax=Desulfogranum japonicum TaxID=231447 RepID=UPI0005540B49